MDTTYKINFSDSSIPEKTVITLLPNTTNDTSTSLVLHGYGSLQYGEHLWENMVHLLENFCSKTSAPDNPTEGQLWYKSSNRTLNLYTKNSSGVLDWVNIIPNFGFDASASSLGNDSIPTLATVKNLLADYVGHTGNNTISGDLYLNDSTSNYTASGAAYVPNITTTTNRFLAASRFYVDNKALEVVTAQLKLYAPASTSSVTAASVLEVLGKTSATSNPYLDRNSTDAAMRTMTKPLMLRNIVNTTQGVNDDEAISKRYLTSVLNADANRLTSTNIVNLLNTAITSGSNPTPFLSKYGGTVISGEILLPTTTSDTSDNASVTKKYVDDQLQKVVPIPLTSTINVSNTKLPDGTIMVYGHGLGKIVQSETTVGNANTNSKTWFNANIVFPDGVVFGSTNYAVTVTEDVTGTAPAAYPKSRTLIGTSLTNKANQTLWPLTFSVYGKTVSGFKICVFSPNDIDVDYVAKTLSFNFIAIGR